MLRRAVLDDFDLSLLLDVVVSHLVQNSLVEAELLLVEKQFVVSPVLLDDPLSLEILGNLDLVLELLFLLVHLELKLGLLILQHHDSVILHLFLSGLVLIELDFSNLFLLHTLSMDVALSSGLVSVVKHFVVLLRVVSLTV